MEILDSSENPHWVRVKLVINDGSSVSATSTAGSSNQGWAPRSYLDLDAGSNDKYEDEDWQDDEYFGEYSKLKVHQVCTRL